MTKDSTKEITHIPVLLQEVIDELQIAETDIVFDGTLGASGHANAIVGLLSSGGVFVGVDRDEDSVVRAREILKNADAEIYLSVGNFRNIADTLESFGIEWVDKIFLDLGWNRMQLASGRGFSFDSDEPLLMTYEKSPSQARLTARDIVNDWREEDIANVFFGYGEEKYSRRFARAIVKAREDKPIETSRELADIIRGVSSKKYSRIHPATRIFQALRIAVNDELDSLIGGIKEGMACLSTSGRMAIVTFHSIEDRVVKKLFIEYEKLGVGRVVTKKPMRASKEEVEGNPASRSAMLRIFEKS